MSSNALIGRIQLSVGGMADSLGAMPLGGAQAQLANDAAPQQLAASHFDDNSSAQATPAPRDAASTFK